jgi:hypothetical protein
MDRLNKILVFWLLLLVTVSCDEPVPPFGDKDMNSNENQLQSNLFVLDYRTVTGPELGEKLQEYQRSLKIDRKSGTAFLEKHRSPSDEPGEPIGTFRAKLSEDIFQNIFDIVQKADFSNLPSATEGGMGITDITLKFEHNNTTLSKQFTSRDINLLERLDSLLEQLNQIAVGLEKHAESAVKIDIKHTRGQGDGQFKIMITNVGSQPVCIADPHTFGDEDPDRWAGVRFAELPEERPGYTSPPLEWSNLILPVQKAQGTRVVLKPSKTFSGSTNSWTAPRRNARYIIQAIFSDYKGPGDANDGYPVRGAVFSEAIEITVK